jgi:hypothetical protein
LKETTMKTQLTLLAAATGLAVVAAVTGGVAAFGLVSLSGGLATLAMLWDDDDDPDRDDRGDYFAEKVVPTTYADHDR